MLVRADIHALVDARSSEIWGADYETMLSEKHLVGAQQLVANVNRAGGWVTKSTFKLSELYHQEGIFDLNELSDFESTVPEDLLDADYHSEYTVPSQTKYVQEQASATFYDIAPEIQQATLTTRAMAMIDKIVDQEALPIHQIIPQPHHYGLISPSLVPKQECDRLRNGLVYQYIHPVMRQLFPHSVTDPEGEQVTELPHYDETAHVFLKMWPRRTVTWLIPVIGRLPWAETSEARIVPEEAYRNPNAHPPSDPPPLPIIWTGSQIRQFWSYVLFHYQNGTFGPLTITYIPSFQVQSKSSSVDLGYEPIPVIRIRCYGAVAMKVRLMITCFDFKPPNQSTTGLHYQSKTQKWDDKGAGGQESSSTARLRWEDMRIAPFRRGRLPMLDEDGALLLIA